MTIVRITTQGSVIFKPDIIETYLIPKIYHDPNPLKINKQGVSILGTSALPKINDNILYPYVPDYINQLNINFNEDVKRKMTQYFYDKMKKWLKTDMQNILNYITIINNEPQFITSKDEKSIGDIDEKIKYLMNIIVSDIFIYNTLQKYINKTNTSWYDLIKNKMFVKGFIVRRIKDQIKHYI